MLFVFTQPLTQEKFEKLIMEYILLTDQPFTTVEEASFLRLFSTVKFKIPGADAIKNKIMNLYDTKRAEVKERLKVSFHMLG